MRPSATATIALWASGVTPGARAFEDPSASWAGLWGACGGAGTVSSVGIGMLVDVVELVLVVAGASVVLGALVLVLVFGGTDELDDVVAIVAMGVSLAAAVVLVVSIAAG
jgi:hypothetical protein